MLLAFPCASWVAGYQLNEFWNGQEISYNQLLASHLDELSKTMDIPTKIRSCVQTFYFRAFYIHV